MDNLWELKEASFNYINKNPTLQDKTIKTAKNVIAYYNGVRHKLNTLKTEILNYNKRFPNNQIKNIEELVGSEIKSSIKTTIREEIIKYCKD